MEGLFWLAVLGLLIFYAVKGNKSSNSNSFVDHTKDRLDKRNQEWIAFIKGYFSVAKTKAEKQLLDKMLSDIDKQGLNTMASPSRPKVWNMTDVDTHSNANTQFTQTSAKSMALNMAESNGISDTNNVDRNQLQIKLDNISLLLYFGAFLFVSSVGLFVAFSGASGLLRTISVLVVALVMYMAGIWIFKNKQKLQPAGLAFAGMGIAITPLVGVAAYNYLYQNSAPQVWFITSVLCLALYLHAMFTIKKPLITYIFIFTLLSLFESSMAIINAPIYYFGWMMALLSILLQASSRYKGFWPEFRESSKTGGQLILPLSIIISLVLIGAQGFGQFGVSLLLGAIYYGLEGWNAKNKNLQWQNLLIAHICFNGGFASLLYALTNNGIHTGVGLIILAIFQLYITATSASSKVMENFGSILIGTLLIAAVLLISSPIALFISIIAILLAGAIIWAKQSRTDAYVIGALAWFASPIVFGQLVLNPSIGILPQSLLVLAGLVIHITIFELASSSKKVKDLGDTGRTMIVMNIIIAAIVMFLASPGISLVLYIALGLTLMYLALIDPKERWEIVAGIIAMIPIARLLNDDLLALGIIFALAYNILLALRFRSEINRWISALLWLILPLGLGSLNKWDANIYAWAYMIVMISLVISRAIARGVAFTSSKAPLASYAKNASLSYGFGYITAGLLAVILSLYSNNIQLHTTAILGAISAIVLFISWVVEKRSDIVAIQPIIWQLMLLSAINPINYQYRLDVYLFLSASLALICYTFGKLITKGHISDKYITNEFTLIAICTAYIVPFEAIVFGLDNIMMPITLIIAGLITYEYWHEKTQNMREAALGIVTLGLMWLLWIFNITELQIYTHIVALVFAGFAYWRHVRKDSIQSDNYILLALATATLPLLIQALVDKAGGLYGWWLLIEQVLIMIIGITIRKKIVTNWGLYVAVGSVLYQLRNLEYAALAVLALFVIGIAVYQLQKYNK